MEEEKKVMEEEKEESPNFKEFLSIFPDAPSEDKINTWKATHGDVFCSGFSDVELFIWRSLSRGEYLSLQTQAMQARQAGQPLAESQLEEMIVNTCVLWATEQGKKALVQKGGSISTLHEQIMLNSNFLPTPVAAEAVIKL